jgi:hypothetical protein
MYLLFAQFSHIVFFIDSRHYVLFRSDASVIPYLYLLLYTIANLFNDSTTQFTGPCKLCELILIIVSC